jgi:Mn-dependent DtxR family transcriptional regulator
MELIMKFMEENGSGKSSDFTKLLGVTPQRVYQILQKMLNVGLVIQHGAKRHTYYTVNKKTEI